MRNTPAQTITKSLYSLTRIKIPTMFRIGLSLLNLLNSMQMCRDHIQEREHTKWENTNDKQVLAKYGDENQKIREEDQQQKLQAAKQKK